MPDTLSPSDSPSNAQKTSNAQKPGNAETSSNAENPSNAQSLGNAETSENTENPSKAQTSGNSQSPSNSETTSNSETASTSETSGSAQSPSNAQSGSRGEASGVSELSELSELARFKAAFDGCRRDGPLMVYVCKLIAMRGVDIQGGVAIDRDKTYEIALCRSFSGTITRHSPLFVIPANAEWASPRRVSRRSGSLPAQPVAGPIQLFVLMGREIAAVEAVPAGNVLGVLGLEGAVMKMGTLSDAPTCPSLSSLRLAVAARVCWDVERPDRADRGGDGARERHAAPAGAAADSQRERQQHSRLPDGSASAGPRRRKRGSTSSARWASCSSR